MHQNNSFYDPLYMATKYGNTILLKHIISISESKYLRQFMNKSVEQGDFIQYCQYFEEFWNQKRAEINAKYEGGYTLLQLASQRGHLEIVKCLIENGADVQLWNKAVLLNLGVTYT